MEPEVIKFAGVRNAYSFLSNFYPALFLYDGEKWTSSEHAYQAAKTLIPAQRKEVQDAPTPGKAKRLGRTVTLRSDWNQVRAQVMLDICMAKFGQNPELGKLLVATGDAILVEHTPWKDYYWGDGGDGTGQNKLGMVLMAVRSFLYANRGTEDDQG